MCCGCRGSLVPRLGRGGCAWQNACLDEERPIQGVGEHGPYLGSVSARNRRCRREMWQGRFRGRAGLVGREYRVLVKSVDGLVSWGVYRRLSDASSRLGGFPQLTGDWTGRQRMFRFIEFKGTVGGRGHIVLTSFVSSLPHCQGSSLMGRDSALAKAMAIARRLLGALVVAGLLPGMS
jgi:hypothetical protein